MGRGDAHTKKHIWRLEANLRESIFSFHHANSSKHFDLLNHLKGTNDLCNYFILNCFCNYLHRKLYAPLLRLSNVPWLISNSVINYNPTILTEYLYHNVYCTDTCKSHSCLKLTGVLLKSVSYLHLSQCLLWLSDWFQCSPKAFNSSMSIMLYSALLKARYSGLAGTPSVWNSMFTWLRGRPCSLMQLWCYKPKPWMSFWFGLCQFSSFLLPSSSFFLLLVWEVLLDMCCFYW